MGWQIKKDRKKGRYRVWSTVADDWLYTNATVDEVKQFFREKAIRDSDRRVDEEIEMLHVRAAIEKEKRRIVPPKTDPTP